jgi:integrase
MKLVAGHLTLKNGRYYAVLNYRNAGGQRKTKWIALGLPEKGNKRKAEAELARLRAEFEPPKEVGDLSSDMLFADYLLEWLEIAKGRLAVATYSSYAAMIKKPVGPYFRQRNLTLRELEARHLQMFYSEMLRKVKPNTVIHYHAIIHSALKYAVKTDMLVQNVADKVDRPKKNSFQPVFLSAEEMQKMFEALRGTKLELPVLVAAFYGFRRGEVLGLKWDAIDFERGTISVIRTVTTITLDGKQTEIEQQSAKTKSSLRTLPLIGSFREYFLQVKEAQELNKQICGNCYNHEYDGFVFVDELGERMRANYLTSAFPKFLESHGLRRMRFHDLRHSCASLLLANGVPLKHIQEWLGHSDFTTTANIYAHLDYKSKITSAQAMETGLALPEGGDFGSRWGSIDVGENG